MLTLNFLMLIKKFYYYFNNHVDALCANYALHQSSILFPLVRRWRLK